MDSLDRVTAARVQIAMLRKLGRPIPLELEQLAGTIDADVDSVERLGLIRHGVAEGIALGERRAIAHGALIGAPSAAVIMTLAWVLGSDLGVVGAGTIAVSNVLSWAYLTRTRPVSVKRWRAEL